MRLILEIGGLAETHDDLVGIAERLRDLTPAFEQVADDFLAVEARQFASQGGGQWDRLKASTVEEKARRGLDTRILHMTHRLRDSLTREGAVEAIRRITADTAVLGTSVPYTRFLRRPVIDPSEADKRRWVRTIQAWLVGGGRGL